MSKIAFIFPGQGAQYVGMGKDFYDAYEEAREVYRKAKEATGLDIEALCFTENDKLNITEYTQIAMLTTEVALLKVLESKGVHADVCAGLSLGEYGALAAADVMDLDSLFQLIRLRGIYMQEAGAKRCIPLKVSGPFHSALLTDAGKKLGEALSKVEIHKPQIPYVCNVEAAYVTQEDTIKELLEKQVSHSVRWQQSVEKMIADGTDTFIEIGPGKTLTGFMRKINKDVKVMNVDKLADMDKVLEELGC